MTDYPAKTRYFIWVILALLLAGCRPQLSIAAAPTPTATPETNPVLAAQIPSPTPVVLENGWYVYTDPDGEFSFSYPPNAVISAGQNQVDFSKNITIQFLVPDKPYQGMSLRLEPNPERLKGTDIAKQLFEKSTQKPVTAEFTNSLHQISVGGISAVQAVIPSTNTEVTIIIPYDDKVFIVSPVHELSMTKVEKDTLETFYQILNTIKLGISK